MAQRNGKCIGRICIQTCLEAEQRLHHVLHLLFGRVAAPDDRELHLVGRVLEDAQPTIGAGGDRRAARLLVGRQRRSDQPEELAGGLAVDVEMELGIGRAVRLGAGDPAGDPEVGQEELDRPDEVRRGRGQQRSDRKSVV